ncbi:MAG TPA: cation:proton antiporter [Candidatus Limnocylindrales bacterium]|nr:cation:proton antiporter [Candidatus Limnocylindrales bacterium]
METTASAALFLTLAIIILSARFAGALARRVGQSRVLGELVVGVLLGPTLLNILHSSTLGIEQAHLEETIHLLAEIGVLLLMFKVGLDVHFSELRRVGKVAVFAGVVGALLPVLMVVPVVLAFGYDQDAALYAGVTLAATSVSISAQVLLELKVLNTKVGHALLATALVDDVLAILLVSLTGVVTTSSGGEGAGEILIVLVRMTLFLVLGTLLALQVLPRLVDWLGDQPHLSSSFGVPAFALAFAFLFGWAGEALGGVATITGAFLAGAGLSFTAQPIKAQIDRSIDAVVYALFVPIFFVSVGLETDLSSFKLEAMPLMLILLLVAIVSKLLGAGLPALAVGFSRRESLQLGVCMISRGEVGLIIMSIALASGSFAPGSPLFASLFVVLLLTTLITPVLVRRVFHGPTASPAVEAHT